MHSSTHSQSNTGEPPKNCETEIAEERLEGSKGQGHWDPGMVFTLFYSTGFTDSLGLVLIHLPKAYDKWRCQLQRYSKCLTPSLAPSVNCVE